MPRIRQRNNPPQVSSWTRRKREAPRRDARHQQGRDIELSYLFHCVLLDLAYLCWLGKDAVAGFKISPTAGDLQQELGSSVVLEAEVLIAQASTMPS